MVDATQPPRAPWLLTGVGGVLGLGLAGSPPRAPLCIAGRRRPAFWGAEPFAALDLEQPGALTQLLAEVRPAAVLHAAALSRLDACEADPERALRVNALAVEELVAAAGSQVRVVHVSTDLVFDGTAPSYAEDAPVGPLQVYGRTKARAESAVIEAGGCVVRLPLLLGPAAAPGRRGADSALLEALQNGERPRLFRDEIRSPVAASLLAAPLWSLLAGHQAGIFHLAGAEAVSRAELGRRICAAAGRSADFNEVLATDLPGSGLRPRRLVLHGERARKELGWRPPDLQESLAPLRPSGSNAASRGGAS